MSTSAAVRGAFDPNADTFPKLLIRNANRFGDRPAYREKEFGIWQTFGWAESIANVRAIACGLAALGAKRGEKIALIGDNRPRLYWTIAAIQAIGGVPVPVYQDSVAEEVQYVLDHAEVGIAYAEDQEQVDKLLGNMARCPKLKTVIYEDGRGMRHYDQPFLFSLERLEDIGRKFDAEHPQFFEQEVAKGRGSDISIIPYTSGTTGRPKGVMLSFDNLIETSRRSVAFDKLSETEDVLAYLPPAWIGQHYFSFGQAMVAGFCVNCPESGATVQTDLREIGPTFYFAPPRVWEGLLTQLMVRMEDAGWLKRKAFAYFIDHARRVGLGILEGKSVGPLDRLLYALGELLIYGPLKNVLGLSRVRIAYTAGEALGPDIFNFYRAIGVNLKQLYGQTESSVYLTIQSDNDVRGDTVGPPAPGMEVRIDDAGEVLYRGPGVFVGYYKNDEATRSTKTADGWVHTGDAGVFTTDGHLKIIDRVKDVGRLSGGGLFAPKYIENKLKFFPYILEAVAHGAGHDHVTAFVNIDLGAVGNWAERQGIAYTSYQDLASKPEVYGLIRSNIEQVNRDLAQDPDLAASQIKRFLILHKELDPDDGEITRTRKVRRNIVAERYAALIDALYSDRKDVDIEAKVTFEDGRMGKIKARLRIEDAATVAPAMKKAG